MHALAIITKPRAARAATQNMSMVVAAFTLSDRRQMLNQASDTETENGLSIAPTGRNPSGAIQGVDPIKAERKGAVAAPIPLALEPVPEAPEEAEMTREANSVLDR